MPEQARGDRARRRRPETVRALAAACVALLAGGTLGACGSSSVSEPLPKSTPDITPPSDTSAEKAAAQTTSTSTTATKTTPKTGEGAATTE
ncbi:MAG: hypothetical protein JWL67_226, partial [Solirubrobacterales bacterium]|nr:hypothetical protein [Solirubrobacterales bacterium]